MIRIIIICLLLLAPLCLSADECAPGSLVWRFADDDEFLGWKADNYKKAEVKSGSIRAITNSISCLTSPKLDLEASRYRVFTFTARTDRDGVGAIYFRSQGKVFAEERRVNFSVTGDGRLRSYQVNLAGHSGWAGTIESIRFDILYLPDVQVEITEIGFRDSMATADELNLVANGDFELTRPGSTAPEGWEMTLVEEAGCAVADADDGNRVLKLVALLPQSSATIRQPVSFDFLGSYEISIEHKAERFSQGDLLTLTIEMEDILGNDLPSQKYTLPVSTDWQEYRQVFSLPEKAAAGHAKIDLISHNPNVMVLVDNVGLRYQEGSAVAEDLTKPFNWTAEWIWLAGFDESSTDPVYFRKVFELPAGDDVLKAQAILTADNSGVLYVNGEPLSRGPSWSEWQHPDIYDIEPYLAGGKNVLAVVAANSGGPAGLLLEAWITLKSGEIVSVMTDSNWKCSAQYSPDWFAPACEDGAWPRAESHGRPPTQPWGHRTSYTYLGPAPEVRVESLTIPSTVRPGEEVAYELLLVSQEKPTTPQSLLVEIAGKNAQSGTVLLRQNLKELDFTGPVRLTGNITTSNYLPAGEYELRFSIPRTHLAAGPGLTGAETRDHSLIVPIAVTEDKQTVNNPTARFAVENGVPVLIVDGKPHTTLNHCVDHTTVPGLLSNSHDNGIHFYMLNVSDIPWNASGDYDLSRVDEICSSLLLQDPDAHFILVLALDHHSSFGKVFKGWVESYPEERVLDSEGSPDIPDYGGNVSNAPSLSSKRWQDEAEELMRQLIRRVRASRYGERVIGYLPSSGVTFEWQQWASVHWPPVFVDYSEPARTAFVEWLIEKYGEIGALNAAWKSNYGSFAAITIPSKDERMRADVGIFLDPEKSMSEIDYRNYYSDQVADVILRLARVIKEETDGRSLAGVYYGYVTHVLGPYRYQLIGHSALHKVLKSPDIDFLMSPSDYGLREIGGGSGFMSATDSVKLHGKAWIDQADLRTHHSSQSHRFRSLADSRAGWIRHFSNALVSGACEQLYDFSLGWTSGDPRLMQLLGRLRQIEEKMMNVSREKTGSDSIAVIVDDKSTYYTELASSIHLDTVGGQFRSLAGTGVGFATYILDDLPAMPDYRCYLFLNTFRITAEQQAAIDRLKKDGRTLIFVYAPGITDEDRLLPDRIAEITGISMEVVQQEMPLGVKLETVDSPILNYFKKAETYGFGNRYSPVFIPVEGEVLGTLAGAPDKPGLVIKRNNDWTSVFSVAPGLPAKLLRGIADYAGVRVTNPADGDITYAGERLFAVHTVTGGQRVLRCGGTKGLLEELVTGETFAVENGLATVDLKSRSTYLFYAP